MRHGNMMLDLHFVHNSPNKICKFRCPPPQRRSALAWFSRKLFFLSTKNMRDMCMAHNQKTWRKNNFWDFFKSVAYLYNINLIGGWRINKDIQYIKLLQILPKWFILQLGGRRNAYVQQTEYTPYSNQKKHMEEVKANDVFSGMGSKENSVSLPIIIGFLRGGGDSPNHS